MLEKEEKFFFDSFIRTLCLEVVSRSKYSNYYKLNEFILYDADYQTLMLAFFGNNVIVREEILNTDIDRQRLLEFIEGKLKPYLVLGLAALAAGLSKKKIDPLVNIKLGSGSKKAYMAKLIGRLAFISLFTAAGTMFSKVTFVMLEKMKSECRIVCKKRHPKESKEQHREHTIRICTSQCKIYGLRRIIAKLRTEIAQCNVTDNPEKCQKRMVEKVATYNDMLIKEEQLLIRSRKRLTDSKKKDRQKPNNNI